ncbi:MAG TPA: chemotaxis protein CheX [Phycisphaerae bacterium]|nr:chemotaxis protein CheX [Phycisphaerae bacterium]
MISLLEQTLCYVAEEQFESLVFLFPLPADPGVPAPAVAEWTTVSVGFTGPFGGRLYLAVPSAMLAVLGSNMLGTDEPGASPDEQIDALKELIHVVCGNLLPAIAGDEAVFDVEAPRLLGAGAAPQFPGAVPAAATRVLLDAGPAELWLSLDRPVAQLDLPDGEALAWVAPPAPRHA